MLSNTLQLKMMFISERPPVWHLLHKTPDEWDYCNGVEDAFPELWRKAGRKPYKVVRRNEPAEVGEIFTPTTLRVEALTDWVRGLCARAPAEADLGWVDLDLFSPPNMDAAVMLFKAVLAPRLNPLLDSTALAAARVNRANMLALCFWVLRQRDLINADIWGAILRCVYVIQKVSLQTSVALTCAELTSMFQAASDNGLFNTNETITSRDDLPETARLHRGVATHEALGDGFLGYSWTDDFAVASTFATRRSQQGMGRAQVVSATFDRSYVAAVFEHHNGKAGDDFKEWLIYPNAQPKAIEHHLVVFDLFSSSYRAQRVQQQEGRLAA